MKESLKNHTFFDNFKTATLFVGAVIGAGMATGREISLFFECKHYISAILAAAMMALFGILFLMVGSIMKKLKIPRFIENAIEIIVALCSFIIFCAMLNGGNLIASYLWDFDYAAIVLCLFSLIVTLMPKETLKLLNAVICPLIILLLIYLNIKGVGNLTPYTNLGILNAVGYAAMNTLFSGGLMLQQQAELTKKDYGQIFVVIFSFLAITLLLLLRIVAPYSAQPMPVLSNAIASNNKHLAGIIILLAVISTLTAVNKLVQTSFIKLTKNKYVSAFIIAILSLLSLTVGFERVVNVIYPIISYFGVVAVIVSVVFVITYYHRNHKSTLF